MSKNEILIFLGFSLLISDHIINHLSYRKFMRIIEKQRQWMREVDRRLALVDNSMNELFKDKK